MKRLAALLLFVLSFAIFAAYYSSTEYVVVTVKDKERVVSKIGDDIDSKYLIYTEDEVFENTDDFAFLKFNSSDIYGMLEVGKTYKIKVVGWRIPVMSTYRNIIAVEEYSP